MFLNHELHELHEFYFNNGLRRIERIIPCINPWNPSKIPSRQLPIRSIRVQKETICGKIMNYEPKNYELN